MKRLASSLLGGLAGAVALNILHQVVKQVEPQAPHLNLVGQEAFSKVLKKMGIEPPSGKRLFAATFAADLVSNALYYTPIGLGKRKYLLYHGAAHGLCAGVGALTLTKPMSLNDAPITKTAETKVLTVALYTMGGIAAAGVMRVLRKG